MRATDRSVRLLVGAALVVVATATAASAQPGDTAAPAPDPAPDPAAPPEPPPAPDPAAPPEPPPAPDQAPAPPPPPPATATTNAATPPTSARRDGAAAVSPAVAALAPAPVDIAAFPPRPGPKADVRPLGVEVHGFAATWWIPWSEEGPGAATDAFRLRFAVLRIDARPAPKVTVLARLGLMLPDSPLLDLAATYQLDRRLGLTFGQFRLPLGAAATTLAPQLVMLDRPRYVYAMTKLAFRDIGVMAHSGPAGLLDGMLHYRFAVASGSGRLGSGIDRPPETTQYLVAGRVMFDAGHLLGGARDRLVAGLSYARSRDPAIDTGALANDRTLAANTLGRTLVPFGERRVTHLAGGDATLSRGPLWAQAEAMYLRSRATVGDAEVSALGLSVETGYTLPVHLPVELQVAARGERFDPNRNNDGDTQHIGSLGLNATTARMRWSTFFSVTRFEQAMTGDLRYASELAFRAATTF